MDKKIQLGMKILRQNDETFVQFAWIGNSPTQVSIMASRRVKCARLMDDQSRNPIGQRLGLLTIQEGEVRIFTVECAREVWSDLIGQGFREPAPSHTPNETFDRFFRGVLEFQIPTLTLDNHIRMEAQ